MQIEFIQLTSDVLGKSSKLIIFNFFYSTSYISHYVQMSLIIRYLDVQDYEIKESLLGMFIIAKTYSYHYAELVLNNDDDVGLNFTPCRDQTYDNAPTMSHHQSGLYKRIININPNATFLNCDDDTDRTQSLHNNRIISQI